MVNERQTRLARRSEQSITPPPPATSQRVGFLLSGHGISNGAFTAFARDSRRFDSFAFSTNQPTEDQEADYEWSANQQPQKKILSQRFESFAPPVEYRLQYGNAESNHCTNGTD